MKRCLSKDLKKLIRITEVQAMEVSHGEDLGVRGVPESKRRECLRRGFQVERLLDCCHHYIMGNTAVQKGANPWLSSFWSCYLAFPLFPLLIYIIVLTTVLAMWTYLKNKYFKDFNFGKSAQADNLFSSHLTIFLCHTGKFDKDQKVFNEFSNKEFTGDVAKSSLWLSGRGSQIAVGWIQRL